MRVSRPQGAKVRERAEVPVSPSCCTFRSLEGLPSKSHRPLQTFNNDHWVPREIGRKHEILRSTQNTSVKKSWLKAWECSSAFSFLKSKLQREKADNVGPSQNGHLKSSSPPHPQDGGSNHPEDFYQREWNHRRAGNKKHCLELKMDIYFDQRTLLSSFWESFCFHQNQIIKENMSTPATPGKSSRTKVMM